MKIKVFSCPDTDLLESMANRWLEQERPQIRDKQLTIVGCTNPQGRHYIQHTVVVWYD